MYLQIVLLRKNGMCNILKELIFKNVKIQQKEMLLPEVIVK